MVSIVSAIDIGSTKITTLIAEITDDGIHVLGAAMIATSGVREGAIVDVEEVTAELQEAISTVERQAGTRMGNAYVSISGRHLHSFDNVGIISIFNNDRIITEDDVRRVLASARTTKIEQNWEIIASLPRAFVVDGQEGVHHPVGMSGFRLQVNAHLVASNALALQNLFRCIEVSGIRVEKLVLSSLASGEAVLRPQERKLGVLAVDIGGGTSDLAIYLDGTAWHTAVVPMGGEYLTHDVALGLRAPIETAEQLKIQYGSALVNRVSPTERVSVQGFGDGGEYVVNRQNLAIILQARAEEILEFIWKQVKQMGYDGILTAGVVLTGGTVQLDGFAEIARTMLDVPVRVGRPEEVEDFINLPDSLRSPAYATALGLLLLADRRPSFLLADRTTMNFSPSGVGSRFTAWLKRLLPSGES